MNKRVKLLLFALLMITAFSSCLVHRRPWKHWKRHPNKHAFHYKRGNMIGGRRYWVRQR